MAQEKVDAKEVSELPELEVVYLGRRPGQTGTSHLLLTMASLRATVDKSSKREFFVPIPFEVTRDIDSAASWFKLKKRPCNTVGGVYTTRGEVREDGKLLSFISSDMRFKGRLPDESLQAFVPAWERLDMEVQRERQMASIENSAVTDPRTKQALEVLRDRYRKVPPATRMAFKMWLIAEMEKK